MARRILANGGGWITNITTTVVFTRLLDYATYSSSKVAVEMLMKEFVEEKTEQANQATKEAKVYYEGFVAVA